MMRITALALFLASVPAAAATVEVADGNWSYLPQLEKRGNFHLSPEAITTIHAMAMTGECNLPGKNGNELDLTVPFAVHFNPDGSLNRIVMKRLGCPKVEGVLGGVLIDMIQSGEYRATGANQDGWYQSDVSFISRV